MKLYLQYARPYEGYASGCLTASACQWKPIPLGEAHHHVAQLLGHAGARFFLGTLENRRCLCIRGIPDHIRDENGRACFIHLLVEAPLSQRPALDRLAAYALAQPDLFRAQVSHLLVDGLRDGHLDPAAVSAFLHPDGDLKLPGKPADILLMPEHSVAHFTRETGIHLPPESIHLLPPEEKEEPVDMYFYCRGSAEGYTFTRVEVPGGETVSRGDQAAAAMPGELYRRLTTQGEDSALFEADGRWCCFIRPIPTPGNGKLALAAVCKEAAPLRRILAFAKADPQALQALAADCIVDCPAEGEYAVDKEKAAGLYRQLLCSECRELPAPPAAREKRVITPSFPREDEEDRIDLLKCRWFWPTVIAAGTFLSTGAVWMLLTHIH